MALCRIDLNATRQPGTAPLLDLLTECREARQRRSAARLPRRNGKRLTEGPPLLPRHAHNRHAHKLLFLAELEIAGDVSAASAIAGCTLSDVQHWRAADPMFERDFALAILAHVRALKQMLHEVAEDDAEPRAMKARDLLESEGSYVGSDGRLNVRPWCNALKALVIELGLDLERWEPRTPLE